MSTFKAFWLSIKTCDRPAFAGCCNTTDNHLNMIAHRQKHAAPKLALRIAIASHDTVLVDQIDPELAELLALAGYKKVRSLKKPTRRKKPPI